MINNPSGSLNILARFEHMWITHINEYRAFKFTWLSIWPLPKWLHTLILSTCSEDDRPLTSPRHGDIMSQRHKRKGNFSPLLVWECNYCCFVNHWVSHQYGFHRNGTDVLPACIMTIQNTISWQYRIQYNENTEYNIRHYLRAANECKQAMEYYPGAVRYLIWWCPSTDLWSLYGHFRDARLNHQCETTHPRKQPWDLICMHAWKIFVTAETALSV